METYYEALGVAEDATCEAIDRAWKSAMRHAHPDLNPGINPEIAKQLNAIHDVLADPEKRASYDAYLREQRRPRNFSFGNGSVWGNGLFTGTTGTTFEGSFGSGPIWFVYKR